MAGLEIDFEMRSPVDIRKEGVYRYMEHPETVPLMASHLLDGGPVRRWRPPEPCPPDIVAHVAAGGRITAHNAAFERLLWQRVLTPRFGWPAVELRQFRCTAATAAALSLPRDLDSLGLVLQLSTQKDKGGKALIDRFSKPRRALKADLVVYGEGHVPTLWNEPTAFPAEFEAFHDYCDVDVLTEAAADRRMMPLRTACQEVYWRSEAINDRGLRIDVESAKAALVLVDRAKALLDRQMRRLTGGEVETCSQVEALKTWLRPRGLDLDSIGKAEIEDVLERDDLQPPARQAIELRRDYAKASTAKIKAFLARAGGDGRVRGAFLFRAAGTGRYSSTGAQVHNLPRPRKVFDDAHLDRRGLFEAIRHASPEWLETLYGDELGKTLPLISDSIRGFIWAGPGHELLTADYSGIEGAIQAWFAGEDWKVKALFDLIADPSLPDMYRRAAAGIYNTTTDLLTKKDKRRQVGKVSELSLGYQGGVGAFRSMARNYSLKLGPIFGPAWEAADEGRREKAVSRYEECVARKELLTQQLTREEWLGAELVKVGWRTTHPAIVASWKLLEAAAREAVDFPGRQVQALKVSFLVRRGFLWCRLPSDRCLAYGAPSVREVEVPWADRELDPEEREKRPVVTVLCVDSQTRRLVRYPLYGGLLFENCLAGGTEVLTSAGWRRLDTITTGDRVWDGLAWVEHGGLVCRGAQAVMTFAGVTMTPEHEVWTDNGWVEAQHADVHAAYAASPDPGSDRAAVRAARRGELRGGRRAEELVDGPVRVRHLATVRRFGTAQGQDAELRMLGARNGFDARDDARDVPAPGLRGVAQHDRPLRDALAQGVSALRRARDHSLRSVAVLRRLLDGHGPDLAQGPDDRAIGQRGGLQPGELCLAWPAGPGPQHALERRDRHAGRADAAVRGGGALGDRHDDVVLPDRSGLAGDAAVRPTRQQPTGPVEPVYDLLNAGPRHRFTVRGANGPIIVSNCVQAIALDLLDNGIELAERAGYAVVGHIHDEIITEVPTGWGDLAWFEKAICDLPAWARGLPLTAGGWRGKRYRKD